MQAAQATARAQSRWRLFRDLLACIRFDEVLILQGPPLLGALFAMNSLTLASAATTALFAAGSISLVAHVFVINDWSGMSCDLRDPNRTDGVFVNRGLTIERVHQLWIMLLIVSLILLSPLGLQAVAIAIAIAGLSGLYSAPVSHMKGVPFLNSALHLFGGLLHFLLGYSVFRMPDVRGVEIGCFLALVFTAGHLTHETRDSDSDRQNGIRTNAVRFGKKRNFIAGLILFTIADVLLASLASRDIVSLPLSIIAALYLLHLYYSWQAARAGLTFASVRRLQIQYRFRYAAIGFLLTSTEACRILNGPS